MSEPGPGLVRADVTVLLAAVVMCSVCVGCVCMWGGGGGGGV